MATSLRDYPEIKGKAIIAHLREMAAAGPDIGAHFYHDRMKRCIDLLEEKADVNVKDEKGTALIFHALTLKPKVTSVESIQRDLCARIVKAGLDTETRDPDGNTPLFYLARRGDMHKIVAAFWDAGADLNARNKKGLTPLMEAAACMNVNFSKALFEAGADPRFLDSEGKSGIDHIGKSPDAMFVRKGVFQRFFESETLSAIKRLEQREEMDGILSSPGVKLADLRTDGKLAKITESGLLDKVFKVQPEKLTAFDYLAQDMDGRTVLSVLSGQKKLETLFIPARWDNVKEMKELWGKMSPSEQEASGGEEAFNKSKNAVLQKTIQKAQRNKGPGR